MGGGAAVGVNGLAATASGEVPLLSEEERGEAHRPPRGSMEAPAQSIVEDEGWVPFLARRARVRAAQGSTTLLGAV